MAQRLRLWHWPSCHQRGSFSVASNPFPSLLPPHVAYPKAGFRHLHSSISVISSRRATCFRSGGLKSSISTSAIALLKSHSSDAEWNASEDAKSRNQKKREARSAIRSGELLATLPEPRIREILSAVSVDRDAAFDALILGKKLLQRKDSKVREGRRRHFKFIGRLLLDAEPDKLHDLILCAKLGDEKMLKKLSASSRAWTVENSSEEEVVEDVNEKEVVAEYHAEKSVGLCNRVTRWYKGLMTNDAVITEEVYSIYDVEFDRKELGSLIENVQSIKARESAGKNEDRASLTQAKHSLTRFLRRISSQMQNE